MTNLYDIDELNPLITNMPPEVQVQYLKRFGPSLIRPFKRTVIAQMTKRQAPTPVPQVDEQLTDYQGLRQLTAQQRLADPNIIPQQVAYEAYTATQQCLQAQEAALQGWAQSGQTQTQAAARHFFTQSLCGVGALMSAGLIALGLSLGLIASSSHTEHLNALATQVMNLETAPSYDAVSLTPTFTTYTSVLADQATQANLTTMVLKGPELLNQEAALQDVGGNSVQLQPQADPELASYERLLLEHGVVPLDASSAAIARYYLPEHLSHVDYYMRAHTFQAPSTKLRADCTQLQALKLKDQATDSAAEHHLAPLFNDLVTPLSDLSSSHREG